MKKTLLLILTFMLPLLAFAQKSAETISLTNGWSFSQADKNEWRDARVPGSVQSDLIRHGVLPDPYWGTNEQKIQWVENEDWDFKKSFTVTAEQLRRDAALLHFAGLDTHADVFLNGSRIVRSENMFVSHDADVKNLLREGENQLYIRFYSPIRHLMPARLSAGFEYPAGNDHRPEKLSVYNRKAPYHFGWDWGIRIVQMGIWRPVWLTFYDKARIGDYFVEQTNTTKDIAETKNSIEIFATEDIMATINICVGYEKKKFAETEKSVSLKKGSNTITLPLIIQKPMLWMPTGWGKQNLYDFIATVSVDNKEVSTKKERIGLRTIRLIQKPDEQGKSFYFEVNGSPFFAKGANYIPGEILTTRQDSAYYERLFAQVADANMNMIRVWGGGIYENDYFYELADRYGILVWQDFMFGCVPYPHDDAFWANVAHEAEQNVKRLRNRACIALWCGNNEVEESIKYWGFDKQVPPFAYEGFKTGYDKTFRQLLPDIVRRSDPRKDYLHSSPDTANWGRPQSLNYGDAHYWGVWYGREPFEILNTRVPRFMSEFGFQAFPEMKTIRTFAREEDFDIESEVMKTHQKSSTGNDAIKEYMARYYHTPRKFEDFVYLGLVMQGEGMKKGMLAHRRNRPRCMGSLYWQLNDSWPVVSWSGIDYFNNRKALHYKAREAFAPVGVDMFVNEENGNTEFYVFSDELQARRNLTLHIRLIDFDGKTLKEIKQPVSTPANQSLLVKSIATAELATDEQQKNCVAVVRLTDKRGYVVAGDNFFFKWAKELNLSQTEIKTSMQYADGKYTLTLHSPKLAKNVFVEIPILGAQISDNFFDLLPGKKKVIEIVSPELKAADKTTVAVKHVRETY